MRLRYRVLRGRFDSAAFVADVKAQHAQDKVDFREQAEQLRIDPVRKFLFYALAVVIQSVLRLLGVFQVLVSGARKVETREHTGSERELHTLLWEGRIKPTDLVELEGRWQTFAESPLFDETCEEVEHEGRWGRRISWGLSVVLGCALILGLGWLIFSIPGMISRLARD